MYLLIGFIPQEICYGYLNQSASNIPQFNKIIKRPFMEVFVVTIKNCSGICC